MPGVEQLSRKKCLTKCLSGLVNVRPDDFSIAPRSWTFPQGYSAFVAAFTAQRETEAKRQQEYEAALAEYEEAVRKLKEEGKEREAAELMPPSPPPRPMSYIVKPGSACQGRGIYLAMELDQIKKIPGNVVQEYIANPLLINRKKFDLRIYVLITSVYPLRIYLYRDGLARFCTEDYVEPDESNIKQLYGHLTNFTLNKTNAKFVHNDDEEDVQGDGSKWTLEGFNDYMEEHYGRDVLQKLWSRIHDVLIKTILATVPVMEGGYRVLYPRDTYGAHCFQLLGFDILVDSDLRPWLIEVNRNPSLRCDAPLDQRIKSQLLGQTFYLLDPASYLRPIRDASKAVHNVLVARMQQQKQDGQGDSSSDANASDKAEGAIDGDIALKESEFSTGDSVEAAIAKAAEVAKALGIEDIQSNHPDAQRSRDIAERLGVPKPFTLHHIPRPLARRLLTDKAEYAFYQQRRAAYELTMRLAHEDRVVADLIRKSHTDPSQGHLDYLEAARNNPSAKHTTGLRAPKVQMHKDEDGYPYFERGWQRLYPITAFADYPALDMLPSDLASLVPYPDLVQDELDYVKNVQMGYAQDNAEGKFGTETKTVTTNVETKLVDDLPAYKHVMFTSLAFEEGRQRQAYYQELIEVCRNQAKPWLAAAVQDALSARMGPAGLIRANSAAAATGASNAASSAPTAGPAASVTSGSAGGSSEGDISVTFTEGELAAEAERKMRRRIVRGGASLRVVTRQFRQTSIRGSPEVTDSSDGSAQSLPMTESPTP